MVADQIQEIVPGLVFIKTVKKITEVEEMKDSNFIFEEDTPELDYEKSQIMPIAVTEYPNICSMASAMEIGGWLLTYCFEQNIDWTRANFEYCLRTAERGFLNQEG